MKTFLFIAAGCSALTALAADIRVDAGSDLQQAINQSQSGDHLHLAAGDYRAPVRIDHPLTLSGAINGASRLIGDGKSHVIHVTAENVILERLHIENSGKKLKDMHSGIFLDQQAHHAQIRHNHLKNNLFGVYVWGPENALVEHNIIENDNAPRMTYRGNGVTLWRSPGSIIRHNTISGGRDGIYTNVSKNNLFQHNHFHNLRFGVHYMYTEDSEVSYNRAENVESAYVLMFSERIRVLDNHAKNAKEHGVMLNAVNHSEVRGNRVENVNKATFVYNANFNRIHDNRFADSQIGIHLTAGSDNNIFENNAFLNNRSQAMYVGTRVIEWSGDKRGNYWSDHSAFDLNGDGIADTPYKPNNMMDQVLWRAPSAKLLLASPAAQVLKYTQQQFPGLMPGGVSDPYPLMQPPVTEHAM